MDNAILSSVRNKMNYDQLKSPKENLSIFFGAVKTLRFELVVGKIGRKKVEFLHSAWKSDAELKEIIFRFTESFTEQMLQISVDENSLQPYGKELLECKKMLLRINRHYSPSFTGAMVIQEGKQISLDSLSSNQYEMMLRCNELLAIAAKDLESFVMEEEREYKWREYQRSNSHYQWIGKKKDFSELAMTIWASGAVTVKGTGKFKSGTFARELGSFFGIDKMRFDQDIDEIAFRNGNRKAGDFVLKCNEKLLKVMDERRDSDSKKTKK